MFSYYNKISNIVKDICYGYIEIKCSNNNCNKTFKLARNTISTFTPTSYCCNMGCSLATFNQYAELEYKKSNSDSDEDRVDFV